MPTYRVTLSFKHPAWDERDGIPYDIAAKTKRDAVKRARRQADYDGHLVGKPVTQYSFTATLTTD